MANYELESLALVWNEQRERLSEMESLTEFNERLQRRWAIETGVIEQVYELDRGTTEILIKQGIDASLIPHDATNKDPEIVAEIIKDHKEAIEGLFAFIKGTRLLSTSYIKELHAVITRHQHKSAGRNSQGMQVEITLIHGAYKKLPNNPSRPNGTVHEYCPPEHVDAEMDRLMEFYSKHESRNIPPDVEAAYLHHRFSQIHPFQDGNGRVARALSSLVFIKAGWFPLTITRDNRARYISALERADRNDMNDLVNFFALIQRKAFVGALSIAGEVRLSKEPEQVVEAAKVIFEKRREKLRREWEKAKDVARELQEVAARRFKQVALKLKNDIGPYAPEYEFFADGESAGEKRDWFFRWQMVETAKKLEYFASASTYRSWVRLVMETDSRAEVLLSFHGMGRSFNGIIAASMCFWRSEEIEEGDRQAVDLTAVAEEVFQINYREAKEHVIKRFQGWIEDGLVKALEMWRKGL